VTQPRGGYQPPRHPAPVSGPGRLSRRTDGGPGDRRASQPVRDLPNPAYGEQQTFRDTQAAAPMAPEASPLPVSPVDLSGITSLNAPSTRPGEPITAGADSGPGPGPAALGLGIDADPGVQTLRAYLPALEMMAESPQAARGFRAWVRHLRAVL
jgi:hypothetical protein